jgi:hypothetical protein
MSAAKGVILKHVGLVEVMTALLDKPAAATLI